MHLLGPIFKKKKGKHRHSNLDDVGTLANASERVALREHVVTTCQSKYLLRYFYQLVNLFDE